MGQPKKMMILDILDILEKYTDADHRMSQKDILDKLKTDYDMEADRKAVRRNISDLMDCGYNIEYEETYRTVINPKTKEPEESSLWSDYYMEREFTDAELRLLIDSLLFSKHIPYNQCKELVEKLEGLSNVYFSSRVKHIARIPLDRTNNKQIFLNIELLDEAITKKRKVSFEYLEYGMDKKLHSRRRSDGSIRIYTASPYQMAANDGKYYLICNMDQHDDAANYRIDRISNMKILEESAKPFRQLKGSNGQPLDLNEYMKCRVFMFASSNSYVKFRVQKFMLSDIVDRFGTGFELRDEDGNNVIVTVFADEMAVEQFAKDYAPNVTVLEPKELAARLRDTFAAAAGLHAAEC